MQKHYLRGKQIYALQLYRGNLVVKHAAISKEPSFSSNKDSLFIIGGKHTQTWDYAGNGYWFTGTDGQKAPHSHFVWDRALARVKYVAEQANADDFIRLTDLNQASDDPNYTSDEVERVEATVSPNGKYILISSIQEPQMGEEGQNLHFALYRVSQINQLFDQAEQNNEQSISLAQVKPIAAFHVDHAYGSHAALQSFQGMAIDNNKNIYVTIENPPHNHRTVLPRQIVRIPWHDANPDDWTYGNLNAKDWDHWATEVESLQIVHKDIYYDVALHNPKTGVTEDNRIYRVRGFVKNDHF